MLPKWLGQQGYKEIERQKDCFGKLNCTIYENAEGRRIYHRKYQGWYSEQGENLNSLMWATK